MAQGLERETKGQSKSKDTDEKISKFVRCSEGRVMGSRRIFPPQFKLQVLDSYRKDEDCKGNQRATARKYGIHRRQIQKWLQVEASLRTSVEVGSERRQASPTTALNLTSTGDAARQRDDSGGVSGGGGGGGSGNGGGSGGESLQVKAETDPSRWSRGATTTESREINDDSHRSDRPELERRPEVPARFLQILKDETEEEDEEDDDDEDDEEAISEEDNMDGAKGVYNNDEALDFSCAALGKRRSFSLQFKLEVLNAFHADGMCHGNQRATARKFGINRRQVQKWLGQEVELRGEAAFRGGLYRQRLGRWLELEDGARNGGEDHIATAAAMSAAVMFDQYASGEYCWDLSNKKRKLEEEDEEEVAPETKKFRTETVAKSVSRVGEVALDVSSSTNGRESDGHDEAPAYMRRRPLPSSVVPAVEEQETALCLVKVKADAEVTSTIDAHAFMHESFLAAPPPFHLSPLTLPAAYDFYSFHCRHTYFQNLHAPKWFQSRAAAVPVPGFF